MARSSPANAVLADVSAVLLEGLDSSSAAHLVACTVLTDECSLEVGWLGLHVR